MLEKKAFVATHWPILGEGAVAQRSVLRGIKEFIASLRDTRQEKKSCKSLHPRGWRGAECWLTYIFDLMSWFIFFSTALPLMLHSGRPQQVPPARRGAKVGPVRHRWANEKERKKRGKTEPSLALRCLEIMQHSGLQAASDRPFLFCFDSNLIRVCTETHCHWFLAIVS